LKGRSNRLWSFPSTTLDDVAQFLSVTKPSIYQHFSSKLKLFSAVSGMTTAYASGIAQLALNETGSPTERLSQIEQKFFRF